MSTGNKTAEEKLKILGEALRKGAAKIKPAPARQIAREAVEKTQEQTQKPKQRIKRKPRL